MPGFKRLLGFFNMSIEIVQIYVAHRFTWRRYTSYCIADKPFRVYRCFYY